MRIDPRNIVEMLQRLAQQGAKFRPLVAEVATAVSKGDFRAALELNGKLQGVLESIVASTALLREQVIHADGMGEPGESLGELAIRARGVVIAMQMGHLRDALRDAAVVSRVHEWFVGKYRSIDDVAMFFRDGLHRINGIWRPYRCDQPALAGVSRADRLTMYLTTVRIAQRALQELGDDPDLAMFLEKGASAIELPDVHTACKQILTVLGLHIDVEPWRSPPAHRHRVNPTNSVTESP